MSKRKVFTKTDIGVPEIDHTHDLKGNVVILSDVVPPTNTRVKFGRNASSRRSFDFARWYGVGIDPITYACQRQVERFLVGQEGAPTRSSVANICHAGLNKFLEFCALRSSALCRNLALSDVNRNLIDGFLAHLALQTVVVITQKTYYTKTKSVLVALGQRGLIPLVISGDDATFPRSPFPNSNRTAKGESALSKRERQEFIVALQQAIKPIWEEDVTVTGELLAYALLIVALFTGRNTTPLLEMDRNCLRPHPKANMVFLVL